MRQHMQSEGGRRETAGLVAALISVGILPLTSLAGEELRDSLLADIATMKATSMATAEASIHLLSAALGELEAGLKEISSASSSSSSNRSTKALSAQKTKQVSNITDVPAPPLALFVHSQQEGDRDLLQVTMRVFSWLAVLLNELPNQPTPLRVVTLLWDQSHEASAMPVGAWQTVLAEVEVYHHWKTAVLPSLPICWENIQRIQRLTHMGRHCLHYHEVHSDHPPNAISADGGESSYFDGKVTMSHWTNKLIQSAWADTQALPWTCLRAQQSDEQKNATDASGDSVQPRTGTFSLDMPRKGPTSQQRKRQLHNQQQLPQPPQEGQEGESFSAKAPKAVSQNARKRSKTEASAAISKSKSKSNSAEDFAAEEEEEDEFDEEGQALLLGLQLGLIPESEDEGQEESGIDNSGGGSGGKLSRHLLMDPCLEEEMQSLFASDDIEWSTSQVGKSHIIVLSSVLRMMMCISNYSYSHMYICTIYLAGGSGARGRVDPLLRAHLPGTAAERPLAHKDGHTSPCHHNAGVYCCCCSAVRVFDCLRVGTRRFTSGASPGAFLVYLWFCFWVGGIPTPLREYIYILATCTGSCEESCCHGRTSQLLF